ncbi:MAG: sel1 repeat family protein [Lentisphaeria bacterium]|nr:sel1 repeat family protein [Lentisphaeria bacterium]
MEQNEESRTPAEPKQSSDSCSCGCGGKNSNWIAIAIWVALLLGFSGFLAYTRSNAQKNLSEADKLMNEAYELFEKQDYTAGADLLRQSAELGNAWAQLYYGGALKKGVGVEQDMAAAVEWLRKSADQNCPVAFYELGVCYENGEGVKRDPDEAEAWYRKALDAGIKPDAQTALERVGKLKAEESNPDAKAIALYQQAIEFFNRQDKDVECAELLRQSAELGYVWAQLYYGRFLAKGIGTALDPNGAMAWFRKAADQNNSEAFYEIGVCYENGEGVEKDLDAAETWYRKAVDAGFEGGAERALERVTKLKAEMGEPGN